MTGPSYSTIDRWLFDYMEGNLNETQIRALELFVLENPELELDLDAWDNIHVLPEKDNEEMIAAIIAKATQPVFVFPFKEIASVAALAVIFALSAVWKSSPQLAKNTPSEIIQNNKKDKENVSRNSGSEILKNKTFTQESPIHNAKLLETSNYNQKYFGTKALSTLNKKVLSNSETFPVLVASNLIETSTEEINFGNPEFVSKTESFTTSKNLQFRESAQLFEFGKKGLAPIIKSKSNHYKKTSSISKKTTAKQLTVFKRLNNKAKQRMRALKRMMDSPLALKNSKVPHLYLPGHTLQDINVGFTGSTTSSSLLLQTRLQWLNYQNNQISNSINYSSYFYGLRGGIGAQVKHTYYGNGLVKGSEVNVAYSPKISLSKNMSIEPSVRFKMGNKNLNLGSQTFDQSVELERGNTQNLINTSQNPVGSALWYKDLTLGTLLNSKWFYAGIQIDNVFKHYDDLFATEINMNKRADQQLLITAGTDYENIRKTMRISPSLIYQKHGNLSEMWMGVNFQYYKVMLNSSVSNRLEPTFGAGVEFKKFSIFYQADYLKSKVNGNSSLSHQFGIKFTGKKSKITQL